MVKVILGVDEHEERYFDLENNGDGNCVAAVSHHSCEDDCGECATFGDTGFIYFNKEQFENFTQTVKDTMGW